MIPNLAKFLFVATFLAGCEPGEEAQSGMKVPAELETLRSNAFNCWQDSEHAPVENSEHCVAVAERYYESFRDDCAHPGNDECYEYNAVLSDVRDLYSDAIIASMINFGVPDWLKSEEYFPSIGSQAYFDGKLMRQQFEKCLQLERRDLARQGFQPATTIMDIPLGEGQHCFRLGHPEFRVLPLTTS